RQRSRAHAAICRLATATALVTAPITRCSTPPTRRYSHSVSRGLARPIKTHNGLLAKFGQEAVVAGHLPVDYGADLNNVQQVALVADYSAESVDLADATWSVERAEAFVAAVKTKFRL